MDDSTIGIIRGLLEAVLSETENEENRYKLRTAIQYLDVLRHHESELVDALESKGDHAAELRNQLIELGYLDG